MSGNRKTAFALTDAQVPGGQELVQNGPQPHERGEDICKACLCTRHKGPKRA